MAWALPVAAGVHALLLAWLVLPGPRAPEERRSLIVVPMPEVAAERPRPPGSLVEPGRTAGSEPTAARPVVAIPVESPDAPESETIAPTGLLDLRAAIQPLEVDPGGRLGRRAPAAADPRALAIARAESIVNARLAALGIQPRRPSGPVALANGGVTVAIPWQGFLREDRKDGVWRRERCEGAGDGEADKAGEDEARRSQCG